MALEDTMAGEINNFIGDTMGDSSEEKTDGDECGDCKGCGLR